jgi:hypothetical protein
MLILGTGGARGGDLVVHEVVRDDDMTLFDCLEHVSCVKVSAIVIITVCIYVYLLFIRYRNWQNLRIRSKSHVLRS